MMKKYVKPELFFESYELSQNIAACGWDVDNNNKASDPLSCAFRGDPAYGNNPDWGLGFLEANERCMVKVETYCYENSADNISIKIFNS